MKTILIAGGAGFIGLNLTKRLLNEGNKIICIDNFHTGKLKNIENIDSKNFKLIKHDIINPIEIDEEIGEIYNLASPASPPHYHSAPFQTILNWEPKIMLDEGLSKTIKYYKTLNFFN